MPKELGPLPKATKEADALKKRVEKLVKESNKTLDNTKLKDKEEKLKQLYKNCFDLKQEVTLLLNIVKELKEEDEPSKVKNYANKKTFETKRLEAWQTQLSETMTKLQPNENEEQYLRKMRLEAGEVSEEEEEGEEEEVEEEEEDDEEEEEEEESEAKDKPTDRKDKPTAAKTKIDEEEDDEEEYEEEVEEEEDEEEEETQPSQQKKASVAKKTEEDEEEEEEEEDEDDEDEDEDDDEEEDGGTKATIETTPSMRQFTAVEDYAGEEEGDLGFKKGDILTIIETRDDGWWVAENSEGDKGLVPSTYLQMYNKFKSVQQDDEEDEEEEEEGDGDEDAADGEEKPRSARAKKLWGGIRKAVKETTVSDVLHAMGAVPSGFRPSTLSRLFNEGDTFRMKNYLSPKLSESNLTYRDLFFDPVTNKIRPRIARVDRVVTLVSCQQIPPPWSGSTVLSRHVRMCLFDGHTILSNIHTVKVSAVDKSEKTWSFTTRISDAMDPYYHAETFIRTNNTVNNLGILFELCVSYVRTSTDEKGEFSCGWAHLPLLDQTGTVITNKTFELQMNGGTPYEKGVEVDPSISRRTGSSALVSLIGGNKQPRLQVRVAVPKNDQKQNLEQLPDTLVGNMVLVPFHCYFRQLLADVLLRDRLDLESTELIHSPTLATFPRVADQHDLMKVLRETWVERMKTVKRVERRDDEFMKDRFKQVFIESVYPLVNIATLPHYVTGDTDIEEARHVEIDKFRRQKLERKSAMAALLSSDIVFTPFNLQEVSFNVIGPHCLPRNTHMTAVEG
ncbi:nephrocystin-1-like isoform X3 [Haliotis asinina]|uniref:nephrocystin-1-like isoform X3 n=1 Tax=Haliotis asinina TaxID=109174 RepID=UPI0035319C15